MAALIPELYVSDLDQSMAFYAGLGFDIVYSRPEERFARLARGDAEIMLEEPWDRTWLLGPLASPRGVGVNFQITVSDLNTLFAALPAETRIVLTPESKTYRRHADEITVRQFVVADPDGFLLRFSEVLEITPTPPPATP